LLDIHTLQESIDLAIWLTKVQDLRQKVIGSKGKGKSKEQEGSRYRDLPEEEDRIGDDPDETRRWEQEEQQVSLGPL